MMKSFSRVLNYITVILLVFGVVLIILGGIGGGRANFLVDYKDHSVKMIDKEYKKGEETFDAFEAIEIKSKVSEIRIKKGDEFRVEYSFFGSDEPKIEVKDGVLVIDDMLEKRNLSMFNVSGSGVVFNPSSFNGGTDYYVNVYVPEDTKLTNVNVECNVGDVKISGVEAEKMYVKLTTGDIKIENSRVDDYDVTLNVGDAKIILPKDHLGYDVDASVNVGDKDVDSEVSKNALDGRKMKLKVNIGDLDVSVK